MKQILWAGWPLTHASPVMVFFTLFDFLCKR
jgi:hypothetical protein